MLTVIRMKRLSIAAVALSAAVCASAQLHPTHRAEGEVKTYNSDSDFALVYRYLQANAPQTFTNHVPRFAVLGRDHHYYLGIGGRVRATVSYDFGSVIRDANMFTTYNIPVPRVPGDNGLFQASAQQTSLFLNFVALPGSANQVGIFIGGNLVRPNYAPALQFAYIRYRGITVGYKYSLFTDLAAASPSIDYENANSFTAVANTVVNYDITFGRNGRFGAGAGVEMPKTSVAAAPCCKEVTQRVPDIPFYFQVNWGNGASWLRLSGLYRNLTYRNVSDAAHPRNVDTPGLGVKLSGSATFAGGRITTYWQGAYGSGISSYYQDLTGQQLDMLPSSDGSRLQAVRSWGAYGAVQYNFSSKVFASATYSHLRLYPRQKGGVAPDVYRWGQYLCANVFWNITPILQTGIEYDYGRRVDMGGAQAHDNRFQTMLQLSF